MDEAELTAKVGAGVMATYPVLNHNAFDASQLVDVGTTAGGTPIKVNRLVMESDLVLAISNVCPHGLAGWSGGAKIIQPGVCSVETTNWTHAIFMMSPVPHIGRLDNPMRIEIEEVVKRAKLHFTVNCVLNRHSEIVHLVAGHPQQAHRRAVELAEAVWVVPVPAMPDIIVVSSYPADVDFWQGAKGLFPCELVIKRGGDIILATPCPERIAIHEHTEVLRKLKGLPSKVGRHEAPRRGIDDLTAANVAVWMARMNELAWISIYSDGLTDEDLDILGVARAASLQSAVDEAFRRQGPAAKVLVMTHGGELCPVLRPAAG
jgi:lactate racemase